MTSCTDVDVVSFQDYAVRASTVCTYRFVISARLIVYPERDQIESKPSPKVDARERTVTEVK